MLVKLKDKPEAERWKNLTNHTWTSFTNLHFLVFDSQKGVNFVTE